jgi:DNA-binding MarR family transcriptional regulator
VPPDDPTLTIARLSRLLENAATADLTLPQFRVLGLLAAGDERASLLAARLAVAKPTVTAIVNSLVDRGYVVREAAPGDRRVVRLSISPAGIAAAEAAGARLRAVLDDVVARCADPDAVLAALDELRVALDDRWAERVAEQQPLAGARRGR